VSDRADHRSVSSTQLGRQHYEVEARNNDAWQNEDVVDWPHQRSECSNCIK